MPCLCEGVSLFTGHRVFARLQTSNSPSAGPSLNWVSVRWPDVPTQSEATRFPKWIKQRHSKGKQMQLLRKCSKLRWTERDSTLPKDRSPSDLYFLLCPPPARHRSWTRYRETGQHSSAGGGGAQRGKAHPGFSPNRLHEGLKLDHPVS